VINILDKVPKDELPATHLSLLNSADGSGSSSRQLLTACTSRRICSAPTVFRGRLLTTAPVNRVITKLRKSLGPSATHPESHHHTRSPYCLVGKAPYIFLKLYPLSNHLRNRLDGPDQVNNVGGSPANVFNIHPGCLEHSRQGWFARILQFFEKNNETCGDDSVWWREGQLPLSEVRATRWTATAGPYPTNRSLSLCNETLSCRSSSIRPFSLSSS
jgi:hypothetical protein